MNELFNAHMYSLQNNEKDIYSEKWNYRKTGYELEDFKIEKYSDTSYRLTVPLKNSIHMANIWLKNKKENEVINFLKMHLQN
jgi:hypothetical protein